MITTRIKNGKFYCGFCVDENGKPTITQADVNYSEGKGAVSSTIKCERCGRSIPQRHEIK